MKKITLTFIIMAALLGCKTPRELETVDTVDLNRYAGTWYEIARLPNSFEKGLECVTATYTLKENGKIQVINRGHKIEDRAEVKDAKGTAWVPDKNFPGRLKVTFFWPFAGNYYIMSLDEDYAVALVGDPSRKYLWILAREKKIDQQVYDELINLAKSKGFDTDKMVLVKQDCKGGER